MNLLTLIQNQLVSIQEADSDNLFKKLIDSEFKGKKSKTSEFVNNLIKRYGFCWDPLAEIGYLSFKPYASFMVEAVKLHLWKQVQSFCFDNNIPLQRISGGDLYSMNSDLMKEHVMLAEQVGMYGEGLLAVSGNQVLRFSGCSNKLSLLKKSRFDDATLPFGIFEISNSYRYENELDIDYLMRVRKFCLPELHIVNKNLHNGLEMMLKGHSWIDHSLKSHDFDYIMLISTTKKFVENNMWFIEKLCFNCNHPPVINIAETDTCENGIVFDVEYKAQMHNGMLLEIGTLQIDEGNTGFSYGIRYNDDPVCTIHAVFFASSVERTIYSYFDRITTKDGNNTLPNWLSPVHCRIIPDHIYNLQNAEKIAKKLLNVFRVEIDDRSIDMRQKIEDAVALNIPYIIKSNDNISLYEKTSHDFIPWDMNNLLDQKPDDSFVLGQFSPIKLSKRVIF